ncbi:hypothetical protein, partial [Mycobacterium tuberculosis]|uniref:hypothetical protein n=1 Tax=Mycobacterium tuberculosis TaxID=1773 RepID=UPI001C0065E8
LQFQDANAITGGFISVPLVQSGGTYAFGTNHQVQFQNSGIIYNPMNMRFGFTRMPLIRVSYREVKWEMDQ